MKVTLQMKFFLLFVLVVLFMTFGISATYYVLTKRDKQHESRQRIQIAFDILLDDYTERIDRFVKQIDEFLGMNRRIGNLAYMYAQDGGGASKRAIGVYLFNIVNELQEFAHIASPNRLLLYDAEKRLIVLYRHDEQGETVGGYVTADTGKQTYLPLENPEIRGKLLLEMVIPEANAPEDVPQQFDRELPNAIETEIIIDNSRFGIRVISPVIAFDRTIGVLVSDIFYTKAVVERYALLSKTHINLFTGDHLSVGTLPTRTAPSSVPSHYRLSCEDIIARWKEIEVYPIRIGEQDYYQGQCAFTDYQGNVGTLTASLSKDIERQAIAKIVEAVFSVAALTFIVGAIISTLVTRPSIHAIRDMVSVITAVTDGDLRKTALTRTHDEIGVLGEKLNKMTAQLRSLSGQVQQASRTVNSTADVILSQMDVLVRYTEQESASVDNATISVEKVKQFIDDVSRHTNDLLSASAQILVSIQQTRASIDEVTTSTGTLSTHLERIVASVDQVGHAIKDIAGDSRQLADVAQQTETEIARIDHSLQEVSQNAGRSQELAKETMNAAISGQTSVDASIRGIAELKTVVGNTANIIQEVNKWGEQVSSILNIVDEITEQTSLLSLNAAIISAQAGTHGRGFAVVADQIKNLAIRTKSSTQEIGTLVQALQRKTSDGVKNIAEGMRKADESVRLVHAVKSVLDLILESATRTSTHATDTAQVMQNTAGSSQKIRQSITSVTAMVSHIGAAIQAEEQNIGDMVSAVETIRDMAAHVNTANVEQRRAATQIAESMESVTTQFTAIATQTEELNMYAEQIVSAMHTIEETTEHILDNTTHLSNHTVKNLLNESEVLQNIVNIFKVE